MIIIDLETTGTNSDKHAIISIGAIELERPENEFYTECRIWDGANIDHDSLDFLKIDIHDITNPSKQAQIIALEALVRFSETCTERTLAGHNVHFDTAFLQASFDRENINYPFPRRIIDTHSLTLMHMINHSYKIPVDFNKHRTNITSDEVFSYVGISKKRTTHNALEDAKMTAESISRLLFSKKLLPEFSDDSIPEYFMA